jgi:HTH-like domain
MKTIAEVIGVSRPNLIERLQERPKTRIGRPPLPDNELMAEIKAVIAELPTDGYRRVHAILKRRAVAAGNNQPNHKRVYRVMMAAVSCSIAIAVVPSGGTTVGSQWMNAIGAGALTASRLAATTVPRCGVNAASKCAEVKFPSWRVSVISRLNDLQLHFWVADRGGAAAVPGLAS